MYCLVCRSAWSFFSKPPRAFKTGSKARDELEENAKRHRNWDVKIPPQVLLKMKKNTDRFLKFHGSLVSSILAFPGRQSWWKSREKKAVLLFHHSWRDIFGGPAGAFFGENEAIDWYKSRFSPIFTRKEAGATAISAPFVYMSTFLFRNFVQRESAATKRSLIGKPWVRGRRRVVGNHHVPNFRLPYGCFLKWWYLQIIQFNKVFHYKPSILGYPYFWKHPYLSWFICFRLKSSTNGCYLAVTPRIPNQQLTISWNQ